MVNIVCQRIYQKEVTEGYRILVDRLWPRGIKKEEAQIDRWTKEVAPSNELRKWFSHIPERYETFAEKYRAELDLNPAAKEMIAFCRNDNSGFRIILLYAAKDEERNNAIVLKEWLDKKINEPNGGKEND